MAKSYYLSPTAPNSGLTTASLGLTRALDELGVKVGFFKPVTQTGAGVADSSIYFANKLFDTPNQQAISIEQAQSFLSLGKKSQLLEKFVDNFRTASEGFDAMVIEGIAPTIDDADTNGLNADISNCLNAEIILIAPASHEDSNSGIAEMDHHLSRAISSLSTVKKNIIGCIINHVITTEPVDSDLDQITVSNLNEKSEQQVIDFKLCSSFSNKFGLVGQIPHRPELQSPRVIDVARALNLSIPSKLNCDDILHERRVTNISVCARSVENLVTIFNPGTLLVTPGDRNDVLLAACMAAQNGTQLAGIILTGNLHPNSQIMALCLPTLRESLPIFNTQEDTFKTTVRLSALENKVALDDLERIKSGIANISENLNTDWLKENFQKERSARFSPAAFRFELSKNAKAAKKTIVLPEGAEPRTVRAASICHQRKIATCVLLGKEEEIRSVALRHDFQLPDDIQIVDPDEVRKQYVVPMTELRKHKNLSPQAAESMLEDNVVLGTMMLAQGVVDGLVSGAIHTTANTVRPAFQLIKTAPSSKIVSSIFFMCLPEQVLVYGDCAINPEPDAEQLADIAIQSADSATAFGIEPKIAMISYSTGTSGEGKDVEKVRKATKIAQEKRPDLLIDGPLQYDAAAIEDVAKKKAPNSKVAGKATVFIFPDLNTGNTTYKAVQRSANVISIGPMLQGLRKPVNDLSRGALIEDIVFTIALTAVQATQNND